MNIQTIEIDSPFGVRVPQRLHQQDIASNKLMIILPGRNYTIYHPALFYMTRMGLENGYDVLPVQYGFQVTGDLEPQQIPLLEEDVRLATQPVLKRSYREICLVGKSLGSPLAIDLARTLDVDALSLILLTPVGAAMQSSTGFRVLGVIGTADPLYSEAVIKATSDKVTWRVFKGINHGLLDDRDWRHSAHAIEEIISDCEAFLRGEL
ncbi:MAG: hypothetical protein K8J31_16850 [Anaerolineae bacterium]|nr:hypothetical protein [Anaerolineae bacterium]